MIRSLQPDCLNDLIEIEKGAIRLFIPYVTMFKNKAGGRSYSGHSIQIESNYGYWCFMGKNNWYSVYFSL